MKIPAPRLILRLLPAIALALPVYAEDPPEENLEGFTVVMASQDLSVRRGEDKAVTEKGVHIKNVKRREKHKLDRISLLRFDSEHFGEGVRAVGLRLDPVNFSDYNKAMRFRVYVVLDGDEQDEKFTEKDYDPAHEDSVIDRRLNTMLHRKQVAILGNFSTEKDETVLFGTENLLNAVRGDTNGTVTLAIVRETESWHNSTFATRQAKNGPRLVMKLEEEKADAEQEAAEEADEPEAQAEPVEPAPAEPAE